MWPGQDVVHRADYRDTDAIDAKQCGHAGLSGGVCAFSIDANVGMKWRDNSLDNSGILVFTWVVVADSCMR